MISALVFTLLLQQVYTNADFVRVDGANLQARFNAAVQQGRQGGDETFWVAYRFPVRDGVRVDARSEGLNITRSSDGIEWVPDDRTPQRVGLFFLTRKSDGGIDHVRILDLNSNYRFHDRRVYWAGDGATAESLDLLTALLGKPETAPSILTTAISIHETSGALEKLIALTRGPYPSQIRRTAISQLGQEIGARAADELNRIASDPAFDAELQRAAVSALGRRPNDESIPILIKIAQQHSDRSIRKQAVDLLGQKRDPRAFGFLEQQLRQK